MTTPLAAAQQQTPPCPFLTTSTGDPGTFEHRWAGFIATVCTLEGPNGNDESVWIGEDGGRIRHRNPSNGLWSYQAVPFEVRGIIRRIHFQSDREKGWAVSSDGWILRTVNGGGTWDTQARMTGSFGKTEWEDLYDIWMHPNGNDGILLGLRGIWTTEYGGHCWERAELHDSRGELGQAEFLCDPIELYGLSVQLGGDWTACGTSNPTSDFLGLVVSEPGYIFRSLDYGLTWTAVFDVNTDLSVVGCLGAATAPGEPGQKFELWRVAISNHPTDPLAITVGGVGAQCGLILASKDNGCSWGMELHECEPQFGVDCTVAPYVGSPRRHVEFKTLYELAIFGETNAAVAVGYNGQQLLRGMTEDDPPLPIWHDRSEMGDIADAPHDVVIYPLWSVSAVQATDAARAWLTGLGGHVRLTVDGGDTWDHELLGEPFRTYAAFFRSKSGFEDEGWLVGQGYRVAFSIDGGKNWTQRRPDPFVGNTCALHDITFAGNLDHGVAVGCSTSSFEGPKLLYTDRFDTVEWEETSPSNVTYFQNGTTHKQNGYLRRVAWGGDNENLVFWAAGKRGLILRTEDGGVNWDQVTLPSSHFPEPLDFDIHSVAATDGVIAVFVGSHGTMTKAWRCDLTDPQSPSWTELPTPSGVSVLTDVVIHSSGIYAVGQRSLGGGAVEGVVLKSNSTLTALELLEGPYHPDGTPDCPEGGQGLLVQNIRTLTRLAFDPTGNLWIAGLCGRVWERESSSSTWVEHKSQTGSDIRSMQFLSDSRAYLNGLASNEVMQVLVRLNR